MSELLNIQASRPPDNRYFKDAIVSWDVVVRGLHGTTGIIVPGFRGEFDLPQGGELVSLLKPEDDERIEFSVLDSSGRVMKSMILSKDKDSKLIFNRKLTHAPAHSFIRASLSQAMKQLSN